MGFAWTRTGRGGEADRQRSRAGAAAQVILVFVGVLYVVELVDTVLGNRLDAAGVLPRELDGLDGIVFAPVLHAGWEHLVANTVPLLVFGFLILLAGVGRWLVVTAVVWLVGGAGVWLTGGENTVHLGASVLVFGWLVYLIVRGLFSHSATQVLLGLALLVLYGGVLWGVLPGRPGVSWQATSSAGSAASVPHGGSVAATGCRAGRPEPVARTLRLAVGATG